MSSDLSNAKTFYMSKKIRHISELAVIAKSHRKKKRKYIREETKKSNRKNLNEFI